MHSFSRNKIGNSEYYDIEPFLGYSGPLLNTENNDFIWIALNSYSDFCRKENIIAEIIRFSPLLSNHSPFIGSSLSVFPSKEIVILDCFSDEQQLLKQVNESGSRKIKKGKRLYKFESPEKKLNLDKFIDFYRRSILRVKGDQKWLMDNSFWERVYTSPLFNINWVVFGDEVISGNLDISHNLASYYLFAGNSETLYSGASELNIFSTTLKHGSAGTRYFILGGGNTTGENDSLLRFKKKFSKGNTYQFYMGKICHNKSVYDDLCKEVISIKPEIANLNFFLKYRLL